MVTNISPQKVTTQPRQSWWASLLILCAILGALLGLSFKSRDMIRRQSIPADNYPALSQEYLMVKRNADDERLTIAALQKKVSQYENGTASKTKQDQALLSDLDQTKFQAGLTEAVGPGVVVTLNDSKKQMPMGWPAGAAPPNIIHDTDINQVVNELKAAGAEAISINNQRLIATSPVRCAGPTVFVNNTAQTPPYVVRAIGDAPTLQTAINLPGGVGDQIKAFDPAMIKVEAKTRLLVPAYSGASQPKYAKPVTVTAASSGPRVAATQ